MDLSRRSFVRALGVGGVAVMVPEVVSARGREGGVPLNGPTSVVGPIRLNSNENPLGPSQESLHAIQRAFGSASRYPRKEESDLREALAEHLSTHPDRIVLGCGSTEILTTAVTGHTTVDRHLVTASPTFETAEGTAVDLGHPVRSVPVTPTLHLDLDAMAAAATGAGLVFLCNPNNPTATVHGASTIENFVDRVHRRSPETVILIDEAYHDYVSDSSYRTAMPLARSRPNVIVSRTFSKAHGMAGMRIGYAVGDPKTLAPLKANRLQLSVNMLALAGARAAFGQAGHLEEERARNQEARRYTRSALARMGFPSGESDANFIMVDIGRDSRGFQEACRRHDVWVGRPFPPLTTHARISIGTMEEMRRATAVFELVLSSAR